MTDMQPSLLSTSVFFKTAWERYKGGIHTYLKISIPFGILLAILRAISPEQVTDNALFGLIHTILVIAVVIWFSSVFALSMMYAVSDDAKSSVSAYYEKGRAMWRRYFFTKLLQGVMVLAGFILLVIPGFILLTKFVIADWVAIFESMRPRDALRQSKFYVKGRAWSVFGRFIMIAISIVPFQIASELVSNPLIDFVVVALVVPWSTVCMYVLYTDLVRTKEKEAALPA